MSKRLMTEARFRALVEQAVELAEATRIEQAQRLFAEAGVVLAEATCAEAQRQALAQWLAERKRHLNGMYCTTGYAERWQEQRVGYTVPEAFAKVAEGCYPIVRFAERGAIVYPFRRRRRAAGEAVLGLLKRLRAWLPEAIGVFADVCLNISAQQPPVEMDLALVADDGGVRIDIEIDEPYTAETRRVIHAIGCGDDYRDGVLNHHGWTVVRLAERQVAEQPEACAAYLVQLVRALVPEVAAVEAVAEAGLSPVRRWTDNEALKMAARGEGHGEPPRLVPTVVPQNSQERYGCQLVARLPRTAEMAQKMGAFTEAGRYEQDRYIDFMADEHVYTYDGRERLLPVSSLIAYFFETFDALQTAQMQWQRYGADVEEMLDRWDRCRRMASEVGTFMHLQTERYFRDGVFDTVYSFVDGEATVPVSIEREKAHFLRFVEEHRIRPYRQEWPIYDLDLNIAGTVDMICREDDGSFTIYDWKRSGKVVDAAGVPLTEGFNGKTGFNGISLPDTPFYHYCIQQNLYRYMLQRDYGIRVGGMNLVVLCPDYPTYYRVEVPVMDEVVEQIMAACHQHDLGHRLLR